MPLGDHRFRSRTPTRPPGRARAGFSRRERIVIRAGFAAGVAASRIRTTRSTARKPVAALVALVLVAGLTSGRPPAAHRADADTVPAAALERAELERPLSLAAATTTPDPAPSSITAAGPLKPREVFAFVPYWSLENASAPDLRGLTTIAYFGVDIAANGSIIRTGNGWTGFQSQDLVDLITHAHRSGARVVLTAKSFDPNVLRSLATSPTAGVALARELADAMRAKRFDGVNLDFEGFGSAYRSGFTRFVRTVTSELRAIDHEWQVTIDTYATSAQAGDGFFDVRAIAGAVDALFVMGYDMENEQVASANAPLPAYAASIEAYLKLVPAGKLIYGTPFYGYDWPTDGNAPHARAVGAPTPVTYSDLVAKGYPRYWDSDASVPWTAYEDGSGRWHEVYYDDPSSLALKTRLADSHKLRGVGAWALGMDGTDHSMIVALIGILRSILIGPAGPARRNGAPQSRPASSKGSSSTHQASAPPPSPSSSPSPSKSPSPSPSPTPLIKLLP